MIAAATAVVGALAGGGCSFQLGSLAIKDAADIEQTGALRHDAAATPANAASAADLAYARAVASDVLARGGKDASVPWQNPHTGAGGNITPLATAYNEGGLSCRDFLASYAHGGTEDWLQGAACRTNRGKWEVKTMKPLKRS